MTEQEKLEQEYKAFADYLNSGMLEQDHRIVLDKVEEKKENEKRIEDLITDEFIAKMEELSNPVYQNLYSKELLGIEMETNTNAESN